MVGALVGLIALTSPRMLSLLVTNSNHWIDTSKFFAILDKRIDLDHYFVAHSRVAGTVILLTIAALGYFCWMQ